MTNLAVSVYPNSNSGLFTLQLNTKLGGGEVAVFNMMGEIVSASRITDRFQHSGKMSYQLKIERKNGITTQRLVEP